MYRFTLNGIQYRTNFDCTILQKWNEHRMRWTLVTDEPAAKAEAVRTMQAARNQADITRLDHRDKSKPESKPEIHRNRPQWRKDAEKPGPCFIYKE